MSEVPTGIHGALPEFTDAVVAEFGGPVALAKELHLEYEAHPRGAPVRTRIIDGVLRVLERYGTSVTNDEEKLEVLDAELAELLAEQEQHEDLE